MEHFIGVSVGMAMVICAISHLCSFVTTGTYRDGLFRVRRPTSRLESVNFVVGHVFIIVLSSYITALFVNSYLRAR